MRRRSDRNNPSHIGKPTNGKDFEILMRQTMQRRGWIVYHSRAGDKRRATDDIIRRIALKRRLNHVTLFSQTTIRYRDLEKVSSTLAIWEGIRKKRNPLAAWMFIELEAGGYDPRSMVEAAVIEMEERFTREPPRRGKIYCVLVDQRGTCEWKDMFQYRRELEARRLSDLSGERSDGTISMVNHAGITVKDSADGRKYFVFWNEIVKPSDGSPPQPLTVGAPVTFVLDGRNAGRAPLARCVVVEARAAA